MPLFWKDFQSNLQDSIQMPDFAKKNLKVHFILGSTGHAWRRLTVKLFNSKLPASLFWSGENIFTLNLLFVESADPCLEN